MQIFGFNILESITLLPHHLLSTYYLPVTSHKIVIIVRTTQFILHMKRTRFKKKVTFQVHEKGQEWDSFVPSLSLQVTFFS